MHDLKLFVSLRIYIADFERWYIKNMLRFQLLSPWLLSLLLSHWSPPLLLSDAASISRPVRNDSEVGRALEWAARTDYFYGEGAAKPASNKKKVWRTEKVHPLSLLCAMEKLKGGVKGWGCCRLINVSLKKPAESAALALPPAVAVYRVLPAGDLQLTVSFHVAVLHQVNHLTILSK